MNLGIKSELMKEDNYGGIGFRNQRRNLKPSGYQIGSTDKKVDAGRHALQPGKRISKTGHIYYENRKNRSDLKGSSI
jgi:hypothetical protein